MKAYLFAVTALVLAGATPASATSLLVTTNFSQSTGPGQTYSYRSPTYPHSYIGLNLEAGYNAIEATASFSGRTRFDMPTIAAGTIVNRGGASLGQMSFAHVFTSTQLTGGVNFSGAINYHLGYGPLSADGRIIDANLPVTLDQAMSGGSPVGSAMAAQSATATGPFVGYAFKAEYDPFIGPTVKVGEARLGVTPSLTASNTLKWQGDFTYGYYYWSNTTGGLNAGDILTWQAAAPGSSIADLIFLGGVGGGYYNVLPAVRMNGYLNQDQRLEFGLDGRAYLEALGVTVVDESFNATVPLFKDGQGFASLGNEWVSRNVWSTAYDCGFGASVAPCTLFGNGFDLVGTQIRLGDTPGGYLEFLDDPGGFQRVPGFTDRPRPGPVCDINGCYEVDGFDFPVTRIVPLSGGVPEPATWAMLIAGFGFVGGAMRKRGDTAAARQGRFSMARR